MAITTYERKIGMNALPDMRLRAPQQTGAQSIAKGMNDLASGLGAYAKKVQEDADETALAGLQVAYNDRMSEVLYNRDTGLYWRNGESSLTMFDDYEMQRTRIVEGLQKDIGNSRVQATFGKWLAARGFEEGKMLQARQYSAMQAYQKNERTALANSSMNMAITAGTSGDWDGFMSGMQQMGGALESLNRLDGGSDEAAGNMIRTNNDKAISGVVDRLVSLNPDNPQAALDFVQRAEKGGFLSQGGKASIMKSLRPQLDAQKAQAFSAKHYTNAVAESVKINTEPGKTRSVLGMVKAKVYADSSIPERMKDMVVASVSRQVAAYESAKTEEYSNALLVVQELAGAGQVPSPEQLSKLSKADQRRYYRGDFSISGNATVLDFLQRPESISIEEVIQAHAEGRLSAPDRNAFIKQIQARDRQLANASAGEAAAWQKAVNTAKPDKLAIQEAFLVTGTAKPSEVGGAEFASSDKYVLVARHYTDRLRDWHRENKTSAEAPWNLRVSWAKEGLQKVEEENRWFLNTNTYYANVRMRDDRGAETGNESDYFPVDDLILQDRNGERLPGSKQLVEYVRGELEKVAKNKKAQIEAAGGTFTYRITASDIIRGVQRLRDSGNPAYRQKYESLAYPNETKEQ